MQSGIVRLQMREVWALHLGMTTLSKYEQGKEALLASDYGFKYV